MTTSDNIPKSTFDQEGVKRFIFEAFGQEPDPKSLYGQTLDKLATTTQENNTIPEDVKNYLEKHSKDNLENTPNKPTSQKQDSIMTIAFDGVKLTYGGFCITDDFIAKVLRNTVMSTSDVIEDIQRRINNGINPTDIKSIDLRGNHIPLEGVTQLLEFFVENLTGLEEIDLSGNRIRDRRGQREYIDFENALEDFLKMPSLKVLNLKWTELSNLGWYKYILTKFPDALVEKIYWR